MAKFTFGKSKFSGTDTMVGAFLYDQEELRRRVAIKRKLREYGAEFDNDEDTEVLQKKLDSFPVTYEGL